MSVLGVHDAHDAGAAVVDNANVIGAVNEERFTKRKNDVGFPVNSISYLLKNSDREVSKIAIPWIGGSALFARVFPRLEVRRRLLWRKQTKKPGIARMKLTNVVFKLIQNQRPHRIWNALGVGVGGNFLRRRFRKLGINKKLEFVEHHLAHASSAYYPSGFKNALVITLDGAGDGLSGTVSIGENGELKRINEFKASASLGLLYGAATLACDLRYSEDEGKLMSLAAYSYHENITELDDFVIYDEKKKQLVSRLHKIT